MSTTRSTIYVKTQFTALHRWKDAPEDIAFLRSYHRHNFHVKVSIPVTHDDRDVEFFQFKRELDRYCQMSFADKSFDLSCEAIGALILGRFENVTEVDVSEDGECGAITTRVP